MSQITHNISLPNDGNGDALRTAFDHQNTMNSELYSGKVDKIVGKGLSANDFTNNLKTKLDGINPGAEVNVQPDWNQTDDEADDFIQNKPSFPTVPTQDEFVLVHHGYDPTTGDPNPTDGTMRHGDIIRGFNADHSEYWTAAKWLTGDDVQDRMTSTYEVMAGSSY